ncbi:hypothetical protein ONV78_30070 [Hahella sp. CR1]|uniref:hypothetical protein n=1 Tax=Hahella sp. CR1 TaxID=2992807 RepID=UPI00244187F4|nr:hypothetical protein [Hahella sp. CR1]MDG9672018.1 hypothetical protein [Hahella sp. CR1]
MLTTAEILNLIRLTELEIRRLQEQIDGDDEDKSNEAGEVILQFDAMALKLEQMYLESQPDYDIYPQYDDYIKLINE